MSKKIYLIAGEASGDLHGANLIRNLRQASKEPLEIYGVGGQKIAETGALDFLDLAHFHVTGLTQAILKIPQYRKAASAILASIRRRGPDLVVLIDNPGFNLRLARHIHRMGIPIVYYISPQLWAWGHKRIYQIKKLVTRMLVVFEFEKQMYEKAGVSVEWVGHPLKDLIEESLKNHAQKRPFQVCLLPGSRRSEIKYLLPILLKTASRIARELPQCHFVLVQSPAVPRAYYEPFLARDPLPNLKIVDQQPYEAIRKSVLAIACSGTVTLECALLKTPMIITNRASLLTFAAVKAVIRVPYLGMPNLILDRHQFPEFLQYRATPENLSRAALGMLKDPATYASMRQSLDEVSRRLGPPGASLRAACSILAVLYQRK